MVKRSVGKLSKRSRLLGRNARRRQATAVDIVKVISIGARVQIVPYSKFEDFPHPKYSGRVGSVVGKRGRACIVEILDGGKKKQLITSPVHLKVL